MLHPGSESDLTSRGLTNTSLNNIAEENLLNLFRRDVVLVECMLQGDGAEFGRGEGFEGAIEGAYWCPRRSNDDCFPWAKGGLQHVSSQRGVVKECSVELTSWRVRRTICLVVSLDASIVGVVEVVGEDWSESGVQGLRISNVRLAYGIQCGVEITWIVLRYRFTTDPSTRSHIFIQHFNLSSSDASELITSFKSSLTAALLSHGWKYQHRVPSTG